MHVSYTTPPQMSLSSTPLSSEEKENKEKEKQDRGWTVVLGEGKKTNDTKERATQKMHVVSDLKQQYPCSTTLAQ